MSSSAKTDYLTRNHILNLLSDDEVATVSTAEAAVKLSEGDEYLDLEQLEQGVLRADGVVVPMGHILPRRGVRSGTWTQILTQLRAPRTA